MSPPIVSKNFGRCLEICIGLLHGSNSPFCRLTGRVLISIGKFVMGSYTLLLACLLLAIIIPFLLLRPPPWSLPIICSLVAPWPAVGLTGSSLYVASPLAPPLSLRHMLFGFSSDESRCVPRIFAYLLLVCKFVIWTQHNDHRFRSVQPSAINLISSIKACVKFYLPLFFKRFRSNRQRRFFCTSVGWQWHYLHSGWF